MPKPLICSVGRLVGDAWMTVPGIVQMCQENGPHEMAAGTYALPVWKFCQRYVKGFDVEIVKTVHDPDEKFHPFAPRDGYHSMDPAKVYVEAALCRPSIGMNEIPYAYGRPPVVRLEFHDGLLREDDLIVLQGSSSHKWKNCGGVVVGARYSAPTAVIGLQGELVGHHRDCTGLPFDEQIKLLLRAKAVCSILSQAAALAAVVGKRLIVAAYKKDDPLGGVSPATTTLVDNTTMGDWNMALREAGLLGRMRP